MKYLERKRERERKTKTVENREGEDKRIKFSI